MNSSFSLLILAVAIITTLLPLKVRSSFPEAPNDFVIKQIKRIHQSPLKVISEIETELETHSDELKKAELMYILAIGYIKLGRLSSAKSKVEQALNIVSIDSSPLLYHRLVLAKSRLMEKQGHAASALRLATYVDKWSTSEGVTQLKIGSMITIGLIKWRLGIHQVALSKLAEAYDLAVKNDTQINPAHVAGIIGRFKVELQKPEDGLPYLEEWLAFAQRNGNKILERRALSELGAAYKQLQRINLSRSMYQTSIVIAEEMKDKAAAADSLLALSNIELEQGNLNLALAGLNNILAMADDIQDPYLMTETYLVLTQVYLDNNNTTLSHNFLAKALLLIKELSLEELELKALTLKAKLSVNQGDYINAYNYRTQSYQLFERLVAQRNNQELEALRGEFYTSYKEAENDRLRSANLIQNIQLDNEHKHIYVMALTIALLLVFMCGLAYSYFKRRAYAEDLENTINIDSLTGLFSRRKILDEFDAQLIKANSDVVDKAHILTVAMLDLDHFKSINDNYGHLVGDEVLKAFGKLAQKEIGKIGIIGRLGGEEFLFIFPGLTSERCYDILEHFRGSVSNISSQLSIDMKDQVISVSIGIMQVEKKQTLHEILRNVDVTLFKAKKNGRDQVAMF